MFFFHRNYDDTFNRIEMHGAFVPKDVTVISKGGKTGVCSIKIVVICDLYFILKEQDIKNVGKSENFTFLLICLIFSAI
jgi:hypothetical protein